MEKEKPKPCFRPVTTWRQALLGLLGVQENSEITDDDLLALVKSRLEDRNM